jgi:hypothetical protein
MKKLCFISLLFLSLFSCKKEALTSLNTEESAELCQALLDEDQETLEQIFEDLLSDLSPSPANDPDGHEDNLDTLIDRLNTSDCLVASNLCYACGLSLPPYSMVGVDIDFDGQQETKVLLILTPPNDLMSFMSIQE